jgi:uncharacterized protein YhdP
LLDRLGYAGAVRGGSQPCREKSAGTVPPEGLDYATLSGDMQLDAASKGQFLKLDPGAAGKLLGLISSAGPAASLHA